MIVKNKHIVRVTVLGLAGITVDPLKCRNKTLSTSAPAQPSKMKSVVAFSRNSAIRGITSQSKPLTRSPSDDIVIDHEGNMHDAETVTNITGTSDRPQRHVAVWASDPSTLGSVVTFESNLLPDGNQSISPLVFDLTVVLVEDDGQDHKIALPFGVATLAISGDECKHGRSVTLDLPVLSLSAASPLNNEAANGKLRGRNGYPMIAISPRPKDLPKKRTALQRLFQRQQKPKVPSQRARTAFANAYTVDAHGDAILRVSLTVYEKGSDLERTFCKISESGITTSSDPSAPPLSTNQRLGGLPFDEKAKKSSFASPSDEDESRGRNEEETMNTNNSPDETYDGTYDGTQDVTYEGDDEDQSVGSETYATNDDKVGFFAWDQADEHSDNDDDYTLSFEKKVNDTETKAEETNGGDPMVIDFFGRKIPVPTCASIPMMKGKANDSDSVVSRATKGGLQQMVNDIRDDLTHITADLFGKTYSIPVCSAVKNMDEDEYTIFTERGTLENTDNNDAKKFSWAAKVCRHPETHVHSDDQAVAALSKRSVEQNEGTGLATNEAITRESDAGSRKGEVVNPVTLSPSSAKQWLLAPQMTGKKEHKLVDGQTDSSPICIHDFPPAASGEAHKYDLADKTAPAMKTLVEFFGFTNPSKGREMPVKYHVYQTEVPPIIFPDDDASVGDLTANTHEMNIASETEILNRYHKKIHKKELRERNQSAGLLLIPVPIAFGGDGICPAATFESTSSPVIKSGKGGESGAKANVPSNENYFVEYDDYSIVAPLSGAKSHRDPPPTDETDSALAFAPIEMTIKGFHHSDNSVTQ
jgi:hypothetical protein